MLFNITVFPTAVDLSAWSVEVTWQQNLTDFQHLIENQESREAAEDAAKTYCEERSTQQADTEVLQQVQVEHADQFTYEV